MKVEPEHFKMYLKLQTNSITPRSKRVTAFSIHNFQTGRVKMTLESVYNKIQTEFTSSSKDHHNI
jgi:hypothetical protein